MRAIAVAIIIGAFIVESGLARIAGEVRKDEGNSPTWGALWLLFTFLLILG